ncbi:MAG: hypothetical protein EI684_08725 [Candidatus Viridilinea halotolerans]|uniref:Carboxypeptidase regulatory-like domain-containing protein n=1 Tax=Candidatus Viridilinea halotolerans TaxID=2491704 RepID=A0A426U1T4_9CHLR|nr:MAG: hypothetical protein EI684_08725 [Candidatus Viridilinea halotolerans]
MPSDLGVVSQVSASGSYVCAITDMGLLHCWGNNRYGQTDVPSDLSMVRQVSTGWAHICAITEAGSLRCWGNNENGQTSIPSGISTVSQVGVGEEHTCALTDVGALYCWGANGNGQTNIPSGLGTVSQVSTGGYHTCAVTEAGALHCWGDNEYGQTDVPTALGTVSQISAGGYHTCARTESGTLHCWGANESGQTNVPSGLGAVSQVSAGGYHTCARTDGGSLRCWGNNENGQADIPSGLGTVSHVSATWNNTCAITANGTLHCWGEDLFGQTTIPRDPLRVVTASVSGRVTLNNTGLAGVTISDGTRTAITDSNGNYTLSGLPAGSYTLTPTRSGYTFSPTSRNVTVSGNLTGQNFTATEQQAATYSVRGRITTNDGTALAGVTISDGTRTTTSDSNGNYTLSGLPAGSYTLTPTRSGYTFSPTSRNVTVSGNLTGQDFTATEQPAATYSVSGRITTNNGTALAGVIVSAGGRAATSDGAGRYRISGLAAGNYRLTASLNGYGFSPSSRSVDVAAPVSGQDFVATRIATSEAFDITVSLYNNPVGAQRIPYEEMMRYFADGVFEMSNGAHKLRTVTIYPNGGRRGRADVQWIASCWPNAHIAGYGNDVLRIEMCDTFSWVNFLQAHEDGGYVLAHEWGHYFYALYDEYQANRNCDPQRPNSPCVNDTPVSESIMNSQWEATGGHFAWLNFSTALNNTRNTSQHRMYRASGWETLVRSPTLDPRDGVLRNYPLRPYFPALAGVAPAAGRAPRIDLVPGHTARSELSIVWAASSANLGDTNNDIVANVSLLDGGVVNYPHPIRMIALAQRTRPIARAVVEGELLAPDGSRTPFTLRDDGVAPDATAHDGIYSAVINHTQDGTHTLRVHFSNPNGSAEEIFDSGVAVSPPPGVTAPQLPAPQPIAADFTAVAEVEFTVMGTQADDHGDTAQTATNLPSNNDDLAGKIDRPDDLDLFRITATEAGRLVVRISDLAFGMQPRVRILAADGTTERANVTWSGTGPLVAEVLVQAGDLIYAEVSHVDANAVGGIYNISVGSPLEGESSRDYGVYLPLVRR